MSKVHQLNITKITKKEYKKSLMKNIEIFPKRKMKKKLKHGSERYKNFSEDEKQLSIEKNVIEYGKMKILCK